MIGGVLHLDLHRRRRRRGRNGFIVVVVFVVADGRDGDVERVVQG